MRRPVAVVRTVRRRVRRRAQAAVVSAVLRRMDEPVSEIYGYDRGTAVDRPYIEDFLAAHASDVRGRVLEVKDAEYATRFGGPDVVQVDVVDIDPTNARATIVADLNEPGVLAPDSYDCMILTQVLEFLRPEPVLGHLYDALAPGGVLLITVPFLARLETPQDDRWRLSPDGLREVLGDALPAGALTEVSGRGNLAAAVALLIGLSAEECGRPGARPDDWRFPVVCLVRVQKPLP